MIASGVLSSCEASAMNCRWSSTPPRTRSSIPFSVRPSRSSSSLVRGTSTRASRFVAPIVRASSVIRATGRRARRATNQPPRAAAASATGQAINTSMSNRWTDRSTSSIDAVTTIVPLHPPVGVNARTRNGSPSGPTGSVRRRLPPGACALTSWGSKSGERAIRAPEDSTTEPSGARSWDLGAREGLI